MSEPLFRFEVALSFPGEHRAKVERIAVALARTLGQERILYDRWYAAEFARPNLDVYLPNLYREQSRLLVVFLSAEYDEKEWCGLEWRAARDLLKQRRDDQLMLLRLDNAPVRGVYSIDGYLDVSALSETEVAEEILKRLDWVAPELNSTPEIRLRPGQHRLTIIIPVRNEKDRLPQLFKALHAERLADRYPLILCDDGSTDDSFSVIQDCAKDYSNARCIRNRFNSRKVGAIARMAEIAGTPFVLTLDADCMLSEHQPGALEALMDMMSSNSYAATCFRILPDYRNLLGRLQRLDYVIFTDTIRRLLGVPVCLIGQGVLWKTESLKTVLSSHSGHFHADDLENTVIALDERMRIFWERRSITLTTTPKHNLAALFKQRALSWDFGIYRVLFGRRALRMGGESGAFYKSLLLTDFFAHPFKLLAIPLLLSLGFIGVFGESDYDSLSYHLYRESLSITFRYGSAAILSILVLCLASSAICVRGSITSTAKWLFFAIAYLSSPFVYFMYFQLVETTHVDAARLMGSAVHWLGLGLVLTYSWWMLITLILLFLSTLNRQQKVELLFAVLFAPLYFGFLLLVCRTVGIAKFLTSSVGDD